MTILTEILIISVLVFIAILASRLYFNQKIRLSNSEWQKKVQKLTEDLQNLQHFHSDQNRKFNYLQEQNDKFLALFRGFPEGLVMLNDDGRLLEVNEAFESQLGYSQSELNLLTLQDLTPSNWHSVDQKHWREEVLTKGKSPLYEKKFIRRDGRSLYVQCQFWKLTSIPLRRIVWGFVRDITAFKQFEEDFNVAEQRYQSLVANLPGAVYKATFDANWNIEFLSDSFFELSGISPHKITEKREKNYAEFIHPDDLLWVTQQLRHAWHSSSNYRLEYRIVDILGKIHWVEDLGLIKTQNDHYQKWMDGVLLDITERMNAMEALKKMESRQRALFKIMYDRAFRLSADGVILEILTGKSSNTMPALDRSMVSLRQLCHPTIGELYDIHLRQALETKSSQFFEYSWERRGKLIHYEARMILYDAAEILVLIRDLQKTATDIQPTPAATVRQNNTVVLETLPPVFKAVIPAFLIHCSSHIKAMRQALFKGDCEFISKTGHQLKGAGGSYQLPKITQFGHELQTAGQLQQNEVIKAILEKFENYLRHVEIYYQDEA